MQNDFFGYLAAILLGIVEGLTEFLPVSSTAHLLLISRVIGFSSSNNFFEIGIQLGAIIAVVMHFRSKILLLGREFFNEFFLLFNPSLPSESSHKSRFLYDKIFRFGDKKAVKLILNLIIAFIPAALMGFFAHGIIKEKLFGNITISSALLFGGVLIIFIERKYCRIGIFNLQKIERINDLEEMPKKLAFAIGLCQCLALIPGVSRAGATIIGAISFGLNRRLATEFSFFLAIPTIAAATLFDFYKNFSSLSISDFKLLAVGLIASFLSSILVIKFLLNYVSRHDFQPFAYYRIVLALLILCSN